MPSVALPAGNGTIARIGLLGKVSACAADNAKTHANSQPNRRIISSPSPLFGGTVGEPPLWRNASDRAAFPLPQTRESNTARRAVCEETRGEQALNDLSRVHDVVGIDRPLECARQRNRVSRPFPAALHSPYSAHGQK